MEHKNISGKSREHMKLQQVLSYVRKAVDDYQMIEEGDKIAIGISGGKDSLTLLYALHSLRRFYPKHFDIHAVTVDLGFQNLNLDKIKDLCRELEVEYTIVQTDIAQIIFEQRKEDNLWTGRSAQVLKTMPGVCAS